MGAGLITAAPALAYPPGTPIDVSINREVVPPEGRFRVVVSDAEPGCKMAVRVYNRKDRKIRVSKGFINDEGRRGAVIRMPRNTGEFRVTVTNYGKNGACEKTTTSFTVVVAD